MFQRGRRTWGAGGVEMGRGGPELIGGKTCWEMQIRLIAHGSELICFSVSLVLGALTKKCHECYTRG